MDVDGSFKKPGAVPFKWEIKPGVPRPQHHHHQQQQNRSPPSSPPRVQSLELPSPKLKPPPAGSYVFSPVEPQDRSFGSSPQLWSSRWRFDRPLLGRPKRVLSSYFLSPLLRRLPSRKMSPKPVIEPDFKSDMETHSRWSMSPMMSLSPFRDSTSSVSLASSCK